MSSSSAGWSEGAMVRVIGLVKAAKHNGKLGTICGHKDDGRIGVKLMEGPALSVKRDNLELVPPEEANKVTQVADALLPEGKQRTLKRDNAILAEFHGTRDPDTLALYYHYKDQAYDCFNAAEYNTQMLRYCASGLSVVAVTPRRIRDDRYLLVCLQHKKAESNTLCEVAFQCMRQFVGISMLLKQRCFECHKPGAPTCACGVACFCEGCNGPQRDAHRKLCKLVCASKVAIDDEVVTLF